MLPVEMQTPSSVTLILCIYLTLSPRKIDFLYIHIKISIKVNLFLICLMNETVRSWFVYNTLIKYLQNNS